MQYKISTLILMLAGIAVAQPPSPSKNSQDSSTSPMFAPAQSLGQQINPMAAEPFEELTTPEVNRLIKERLSADPALAGNALQVGTDDRTVMLSGSAGKEAQRELAVRIAKAYAGSRQIEDKINVVQQRQ